MLFTDLLSGMFNFLSYQAQVLLLEGGDAHGGLGHPI